MTRNRRRADRRWRSGKTSWAQVRAWFKTYRTALVLLGSLFAAGLTLGALSIALTNISGPKADEFLFPTSSETIALDYHPHVVDCFKCWTEDPHGNALLMVWSDGQIWRARTDNGETLGEWELLEHVRMGGTP